MRESNMRLNEIVYDKRPNSNEIIGMPTDTNEQSRKFRNILEVDSAQKKLPVRAEKDFKLHVFFAVSGKKSLKSDLKWVF